MTRMLKGSDEVEQSWRGIQQVLSGLIAVIACAFYVTCPDISVYFIKKVHNY